MDVLLRKASARGRRSRARREVAEILSAPIDGILSGGLEAFMARRAPGWPSEREAGRFRELFPEAAAHALAEAEGVRDGSVRLFGTLHAVAVSGGLPDWNYAPADPAFSAFRNDVKFPWEVARLAFVPRLGAAYAVDGNERHAETAARWLGDWSATQRVGEGLHFSSALEVGIRLIALCQALHFFRRSEAFDRDLMEALIRHTAASAAWLDGHLSTERVVAGNHLIGELAGLIVTDLYFPEFRGRNRLARNLPRFAREIEIQIAPDGVSLEQSTTYGRFVADFIAAVLATARAAGTGVPDPLMQRAAALALWLGAATTPGGSLPLVGDNDNGKGVDWGEPGSSEDARGVVAALAILTGTAVPGGVSAGPVPFWWTGVEGLKALNSFDPGSGSTRAFDRADSAAGSGVAPRRTGASTHFPAGGHAVLNIPGTLHVFLRCGPFGHGLPKPSAHSHADWMAPVVTVGKNLLLADPGTYGYTSVGEDRNAFRIDAAHSTFTVGDAVMAIPGAPFRWEDIPEPASLHVDENDDAVRWTGRWRPRGKSPVACARTLVYNKAQRLMSFEDEWAGGPAESGVIWRWRFPAGSLVRISDAGFRVLQADGAAFVFELEPRAEVKLEQGFLAPRYGEKIAAPIVVVQRLAGPEGSGRQVTRFSIDPSPGGSR